MKNISINSNFQGAASALGVIEGVSEAIETRYYTETVLKNLFAVIEKDFGSQMDAMSASMPKNFQHVYEWGMLGTKPGRLFDLRLEGRGNNRAVSYVFKPSVRDVPIPKNSGARRRHKFSAKASVMEFGIPVTIVPKNAKRLLIPFPDGADLNPGKKFIFSDGPVEVQNPGGEAAAGSFTSYFAQFMATRPSAIFAEKVEPRLQRDIRVAATKGFKYAGTKAKAGKVATKNISLTFNADKTRSKAELLKSIAKMNREAAFAEDDEREPE